MRRRMTMIMTRFTPALPSLTLLSLTLLSGTLLGISECNPNIDTDEDGYTSDVDCDDTDPLTFPDALESCDGKDNDCDGFVDEDASLFAFVDQDGDGFGTGEALPCKSGEGFASNGRDCDDRKATIYPAAPDPIGDGIDQSCDGIDGNAPSVGFSTSAFTTLQAAIDAAVAGETVWVGPGTYRESRLNFKGKAIKLISTEGELQTIIDAQGIGSVFVFSTGEQAGTVLEGFTLRGGQAGHVFLPPEKEGYLGGGMFLQGASPTLSHLTLTDNQATGTCNSGYYYPSTWFCGYGGGMFLVESHPNISSVRVIGNLSDVDGGGISALNSNPLMTDVLVADNDAGESSGYGSGGGVDLEYASPVMKNVVIANNRAKFYGGGMHLEYSHPLLTNVTITGNYASNSGGGMLLSASDPTLDNVQISSNQTAKDGGGIWMTFSEPILTHVTLVNNQAAQYGGGLSIWGATPTLHNSLLAYNKALEGGNLYHNPSDPYTHTVLTIYTSLYNPSGYGEDNVIPAGTYYTSEPQFLSYLDSSTGASCAPGSSLTCLPKNLHLALTSPLVNAGNPTLLDVDGSRSDLGIYGGLDGGSWDRDQDELPDYFWPGTWADAPVGIDASAYDADDAGAFGG